MRKLILVGASFFLAACSTLDSGSDFSNAVDSVSNRHDFVQVQSKPYKPSTKAIKGPGLIQSELLIVANYPQKNTSTYPESSVYLEVSTFESYDSYDSVTFNNQKQKLKVEQPTQKLCSEHCVLTQYLSFPISLQDLNSDQNLEFTLSSTSTRLVTEFSVESGYINAIAQEGSAQSERVPADVSTQSTLDTAQLSQPEEMVKYWHQQGTAKQQKQFADWAFTQRSGVIEMLQTESKPVEMMAYWYDKADKAEKSKILSWLLSQE